MAAVLVGVAVLTLLRWIYWMVFQLTGDTQNVLFGWRVWLSFFVASVTMLSLGVPLERIDDYADGAPFFDGAVLKYVGVAVYIGACCLAGAVLYFLDGKSTPFRFCAVFCWLAWHAMDVYAAING